jgi:hypothetical protein
MASSEFQTGLAEIGIHKRAYSRHRESIRYRDASGKCINSWWVPEIKVMMIAPTPSSSDKGKVYQRLGIGQIYLERWVESSPTFENVVLE